MILDGLLLAAQLANPGFEQDLYGWQVDGHRGMRTYAAGNPDYLPRQSAEGQRYVTMGWRGRSRAPRDAATRLFQRIDARRYRGRTIHVSAQTRAPNFAQGFGSLTVSAAGAEARTGIIPSEAWRRHAVALRVPSSAQWLEVTFQVERTQAELAVDDVRLTILR